MNENHILNSKLIRGMAFSTKGAPYFLLKLWVLNKEKREINNKSL